MHGWSVRSRVSFRKALRSNGVTHAMRRDLIFDSGVLPEDKEVARTIVLSRPSLDLIDGILCFMEHVPTAIPSESSHLRDFRAGLQ
jgi:hypothetical protein